LGQGVDEFSFFVLRRRFDFISDHPDPLLMVNRGSGVLEDCVREPIINCGMKFDLPVLLAVIVGLLLCVIPIGLVSAQLPPTTVHRFCFWDVSISLVKRSGTPSNWEQLSIRPVFTTHWSVSFSYQNAHAMRGSLYLDFQAFQSILISKHISHSGCGWEPRILAVFSASGQHPHHFII
jgi:hypothetical protein